jgi:cell division protein FtsQ
MSRARNEWLSLRAIAVSGATDRVPSDEIASATGLALGTSLLDVDPAAAEARVLAHPWVASARVVRVPPSTLVVSVKLRTPVARVARETEGDEWLVDDAGRSFAPASADDAARLPLLVMGIVNAPDGAADVALAEGAVAAQALLHSTVMRPAQILVAAPGDPDGLRVRLGGLPAEVVLGTGQLDRKFAHLARLLSADIPGIGAAAAIDLRFADQAVLRGLPSPEASAQRAVKPGGADPPSDRRG